MPNSRRAVPWRCPSGPFSWERDAPSQLKGEGGRQPLIHWFFSVAETVTRPFIFCVTFSPLSFCDCLSRPYTIYRKQRASRFPYEDTRHREAGLSAALTSARAGVLAAHLLASRPWGTYLTCAVVPSSADGNWTCLWGCLQDRVTRIEHVLFSPLWLTDSFYLIPTGSDD